MKWVALLVAAGCASGMSPGGTPDGPSQQPDAQAMPDGQLAVDGTMPDSAPADSAIAIASFVLSEVNPNITGGIDLLELRATQAGTAAGIQIQQDLTSPTLLASLPAITVAVDDLVVIHLNPPSGVTSEIGAKADCADAACYSGAWDVRGGTPSGGITFSNRILVVRAPDMTIQDAVPFVRNAGTPPAGFPAELQSLQNMGLWLPANCGGAPCTYTSTPTAQAVSADWTNVGSTSTGSSIHRTAATKMASDFAVGAETFGLPN